jgi:hypothetical protein
MRLVSPLKTAIAVGALAMALAGAASAATVTVHNLGGPELVDPTAGTTVVGGTVSGGTIENPSISGVTRSPFETLAGYPNAAWDYFNAAAGDPITLVTDSASYILTFLWGSPDAYNHLELWSGGSLFASLSLGDIPPLTTAGLDANLVRINSDTAFDTVVFRTDSPAFEIANITAAVPLPAGGLLLFSALGGVAALRRRRKSA